jgi:hypothetical protein
MSLDWNMIISNMISGAFNNFILGISVAGGTVVGTRYTIRLLDKMERNKKNQASGRGEKPEKVV